MNSLFIPRESGLCACFRSVVVDLEVVRPVQLIACKTNDGMVAMNGQRCVERDVERCSVGCKYCLRAENTSVSQLHRPTHDDHTDTRTAACVV